jgi:hypothetical protein
MSTRYVSALHITVRHVSTRHVSVRYLPALCAAIVACAALISAGAAGPHR